MKKLLFTLFLLATVVVGASAQKLGKFNADLGKTTKLGHEFRVPYTSVTSYYGYIQPGAPADETKGGKKYYYIYVWIPVAAPEIGVRMVSPVTDMKPNVQAGDFIGPNWDKAAGDATNYFDTWISFERCVDVIDPAKIPNGKIFISLDQNDDSSEMPPLPNGSKYNSLLRVATNTSDPTKALVRGLYRIGFTTYKTGEVQGSFLAQVGAPVALPGVVIAPTLAELAKKATAAK